MPTNLNTASERELLRLPGVGATIAERIVAARPFKSISQLEQIKGIGPKRYLALVSDRLVTVDDSDDGHAKENVEPQNAMPRRRRAASTGSAARLVDLNTATMGELRTLHGVGPTLAQRIIASRPFRRKDEVTAVRGIGLITYSKMEHQLAEIRGTPAATAYYEYDDSGDEQVGDERDDDDKEDEPQAASPTHQRALSRPPPSLSPRAAATSRQPRRRSLPFCVAPSLNLLGDIRQSVLPLATSKLLVASWNIRNLSKRRDAEPLHRIADILEQFDLVALQEVRDTIVLRKLKHFMPGWDYIASPPLGADSGDGGSPRRNRAEHFAFFFRRRVVAPIGAGRVAGAPEMAGDASRFVDMVRAPFIARFKTIGSAVPPLDFTLVNVHVVCGDNESRQHELNELWRLTARLQSDRGNPNLMLLGDFNLSPQDIGGMGEGDRKFEPLILSPLTTTVGDKLLDNIWLDCRGDWHKLDITSGVYRIDWAFYPRARGLPRHYETPITRIETQSARTLCTLELSDHCPVWVALGDGVASHAELSGDHTLRVYD